MQTCMNDTASQIIILCEVQKGKKMLSSCIG